VFKKVEGGRFFFCPDHEVEAVGMEFAFMTVSTNERAE